MCACHLAILKKPYLDAILAGRKTVESRFMRGRSAPFDKISPGDTVYLKQSSGPVRATARTSEVLQFDNLTPAKITELKKLYNNCVLGSDEYWLSRKSCTFGVLIRLEDIKLIESVWIDKKDWRAWVVLDVKQNFGLPAM